MVDLQLTPESVGGTGCAGACLRFVAGPRAHFGYARAGVRGQALEVAAMTDPLPVGILFQDESRLRYETRSSQGLGMSVEEKMAGLDRALALFSV